MSPTKQDDETAEDTTTPDFLKGIESISPEEEQAMEDAAYSGAAEDMADHAGLSGTDLKTAEDSSGGGQTQSRADKNETSKIPFRKEDGGSKGRFGKFLGSKKGKWVGVGVGGSVVGIGMVGFFMLPLKVMHVAENLQNTFFSSSEEAADNMTDRLLAGYLIKNVMPGMTGSCTSTRNVNKSCAVVSGDDNYVSQLYRAWRDNNLEGKLADKHGLEIRREGGKYYVRSGDKTLFSGVRDEKNPKVFDDKMFAEMDRKEVRKEFLRAIEKENFHKRMMYRYKFGKLMERKYAVVRCLIACDYRNDRADKKELRKIKYKAWFVDRIGIPMNETYGLAFECAIGGFKCADESNYETTADGDRRSKFEGDVRAKVGSAIGDGRMTNERLGKAQENVESMRKNGLSGHLFKKFFGDKAAKLAGTAIPGIGMLDSASRIVSGLAGAGVAIQTMNSVMKNQAYVQSYMMYRTNADEIKDGSVSAEEVGYVADSLGEGYGKDQGGGGAESSPYYQDIMGTQQAKTASLFPTASAAAPYKCNDGSNISDGLCPEMALGATTTGADGVESVGSYLTAVPGLKGAADLWLSSGGKIFDALGWLAGKAIDPLIPGWLKDIAGDVGKVIAHWVTDKLLINPMGEDPSGGRMFDAAAMGANVSANDYAHYGLGAGKISDQMANNIHYNRAVEEQQEFNNKSMFARMFDTSNSRSMVSQLALASPSRASLGTSIAGTLLNPLGSLASSIKGVPTAGAAPVKDLDMGGVVQYGYASNNPIFNETDYEKYWKDNGCDDKEKFKAWGDSAKISQDTGMPVNDTPYPCKLLESAVSMNGAIYSDEFLTAEELGDTNAGTDDNTDGESSLDTLKMGTYNVFNYDLAGPTKGYDPSDDVRIKGIAALIESKGLHIVAIQEADGLVRNKLLEYLPDNYSASAPTGAGGDLIIWDSNLFGQDGDLYKFMVPKRGENNKNPGNVREAIRVKLKSKETGKSLYVFGVHLDTDVEGRRIGANIVVDELKKVAENGDEPVIVAGDMNSNYSQPSRDQAYTTFNAYGKLTITSQATNNRSGYNCDTENGGDGVQDCHGGSGTGSHLDQIWVTKRTDIKVEKWENIATLLTISLSDHNPVITELVIPGITGPTTGGDQVVSANGMTFPLKTTRASIANHSPSWCGTCTKNQHHDYNAADIFAPTGTVVVAARAGKVVSARDHDSSSVGSRVTIMGDDGKLYYYAHMGDGTIKVRNSQRVSAGTELGKVGTAADAIDTTPHLHIDVLPGSRYASRPECTAAACSSYPFYNIQAPLSEVFKAVK